jgi:Phage tail tube protein
MSSADLALLHYVLESTPGVTPNTGTRATGTLTASGQPANSDTVTIQGKVYTFQTTLTDADGNVQIGATLAATLLNLARAINLEGSPGTHYALSTTENAHVTASATATTVVVTAKVPGTPSNAYTTVESSTNLSWGGATLAGGVNGTVTWSTLRKNSESLNFGIENVQSEELRPDRSESDLIQVGASSSGDVESELSYGSFDDFLQAVFGGTWTANVLNNGSERRFFTVRKGFPDTVPPQYHLHRGCVVEGMNLSFEIGAIVKSTWNLMGFGIDPDLGIMEQTFPGETVNAAPTTKPMNGVTDFQDLLIDQVPYSGCISKLSMAIKNNQRAIQCLGTLGARDMRHGTLEITGDCEFYFNDGTVYNRFVKGFTFDLRFAMEDTAGNRYDFLLPRCKFETGEVAAGGRNTDVMLTGTYRALYHAGTGIVARVTRTPA